MRCPSEGRWHWDTKSRGRNSWGALLCALFFQWHRAMVCEGCSDWDIFSWEMSGRVLLGLGEEKGSFSWLAWILQVYLQAQLPLPSLISVASRLGGLELLQALEGSFLGVFTCSPTSLSSAGGFTHHLCGHAGCRIIRGQGLLCSPLTSKHRKKS